MYQQCQSVPISVGFDRSTTICFKIESLVVFFFNLCDHTFSELQLPRLK